MANDLTKFSVDAFVKHRIRQLDKIEIIATVDEDQEYYILDPTPCEPDSVYRVHKSDVDLEKYSAIVCPDGTTKALHKVILKQNVTCLRLTVSTADHFFRLGGAEFVTEALNVAIKFSRNGEGELSYNGKTVKCLGNPSTDYTTDLTVKGVVNEDKFPRKFSNEYQVWMDFAILIMGQKGIYIHEGAATLDENGGPSAGCIHVGHGDAKAFYDWVTGKTRILISYPW